MGLTAEKSRSVREGVKVVGTEKMSIIEFGDALIRTLDLDPVYVCIHKAKLPRDQLCRLLLSYFCFYHLGAAAWISQTDGEGFWHFMELAAINHPSAPPIAYGLPGSRWPRAAERRHFRGKKCVQAVRWLRDHSDRPEDWVERLSKYDDSRQVMRQVQTWPMFGPWIAFKVADMMERCARVRLSFDRDIGLMYEEPRRGLDLAASQVGITQPVLLYEQLLTHYAGFPAPPALDRPCGPQEVETVLCKFKSHLNGNYQVGKDIKEVRHALMGWGDTAEKLLTACPARCWGC